MTAATGPSRPTKNPTQDVANFMATSGWTVQSNVNPNDPQQSDPSSTGPQAVFNTKFSSTFSTDPYASVKAPEGKVEKAEPKPAAKRSKK